MRGLQLFKEIEEEVTSLLSDLIRINTTNPPGNETRAAEYVAAVLKAEGFKCELFESAAGRGSMVTRLKGTGERPSLLLLSHLDVVPADPKEWSVDPFGGVVKDGFVWGRGALDMKSMTAIEVMVMRLLMRQGVKLKGDVVLAATADEEKGGEAGAGWLVRNHLDKIRADYVLNERGGLAMPMTGKNLYPIQTAEKGILWIKIRAKGTPGHGSIPGAADNAIMLMNEIVEKLGNYRPEMTLVPTVRQFITALSGEDKPEWRPLERLLHNAAAGDRVLDQLAKHDRFMAEEIRALTRMTVTPTMVRGGMKENIIPSECEAVFDCRILPGQTPTDAMNTIKMLLKDVGLEKLEFEVIHADDPSESPTDTELYEHIVNILHELEPNCTTAPTMLTGGTDSRFFRKMGSICYGFQPMRADMPYGEILKTIHGVDERISIENLVFGTNVLYNVVERFVT